MTVTTRTIDVDASAHSAYAQWSRFSELPRFMEGVRQVRRLDGSRLKWVADVCGERVAWYGTVTEEVTDRRLAWESDDGLVNSGVVTFEELGPKKTRVTLQIEHDEERIAEAIAGKLDVALGAVTEDLETFKEIIEDQEDEKSMEAQRAHRSGATDLRRNGMADMKDEGKGDQVKGRVREAVGKVTGKKSTQAKGKAERVKGKIKEKLG